MATTTMKDIAAKNGPAIKQDSLATFVRSKISQTLSGRKGEEFVTAVVSLVSHNPALAACDRTSLCAAALQAQALGLSLNQQLGQAWIIPYENKKRNITEATFQIGYRGYIQLAIRSGQYRKLNVLPIKEGELRNFDPLNEDLDVELIQNELERAQTPSIGYYAMFEYLNGFRKAIYWTREKMIGHARTYSPAYSRDLKNSTQYSFWSKDFDAMACKTMLRQLITKWGIMSVDMEKALDTDAISHAEAMPDAPLDLDMSGEVIDVENAVPAVAAETAPETEAASEAIPERKRKNTKTVIAPGDIVCPHENSDGSPRLVEAGDCEKCKERSGCPAHE